MPIVLICGGSGLIGKRLAQLLTEKNYQVIILTRQLKPTDQTNTPHLSYTTWNPDAGTIDQRAVAQAEYIINLAGAGIADKRWSTARKQLIKESRLKSGHTIVKALNSNPNKVKCVVNASGIGWYGDDSLLKDEKGFTENDPAAPGFLGDTCKAWEKSIDGAANADRRVVKLRTGIVLSKNGGALKEFTKPVRFGIAAILGNGKQIQSWIHIDDICRMFIYALENENINGVYNAVAPRPVDNKTLILDLARKMKGSFFVSAYVPSFILKIMLGELSTEVLKSTTVSSEKIRRTGFQFIYPSIEAALNALV